MYFCSAINNVFLMNHTKFLLLLWLVALLPGKVVAEDITVAEATRIAQSFDTNHNRKVKRASAAPAGNTVKWISSRFENGAPLYHVFSRGEQGFVIVGGDDAVRPVLAYSDKSTITALDELPPAMQELLDLYAVSMKQLKLLRARGYVIDDTDVPEPTKAVRPMLVTQWGQGEPYNLLCPYSGSARCISGCVATAMAQLMYFYKHPMRGTGDHSYVWNGKELYSDFSSHYYDWDNMFTVYTASCTNTQKQAVAQLIYDCGVSVEARYGANLTEANIYRQFVNYFGYDSSSAWIYKSSRSNVFWEKTINDELLAGRPVYYRGANENGAGHLYVIDGCDDNNYYHINWGWDGREDGFFTITFPYHMGTYWDGACCIIGLRPAEETEAEDFTSATPYALEYPVCGMTADARYNYFIGNFSNHSTSSYLVEHGARFTNVATGESFECANWTDQWAPKAEFEWISFNFNNLDLTPGTYEVEPLYRVGGEGEWKQYRSLSEGSRPPRLEVLGNVPKGKNRSYLGNKPEVFGNLTMSRNGEDYVSFGINLATRNLEPQVLIMGVQLTDTKTREVEYVPCYRILLTSQGLNLNYNLHARKISHAGTFKAVLACRDAHYGSEWQTLRYGTTLANVGNITVTDTSDMKFLVEDMGVGDDTGITSMPLTARYRVRALEDAEGVLQFSWGLGWTEETVSMKQGEVREFTYTNNYPDVELDKAYYLYSFVNVDGNGFYNNLSTCYFIDDATQVENVPQDADKFFSDTPADVFTLSGVQLRSAAPTASALRSLPRGIYVVKQGTKARKVQLK